MGEILSTSDKNFDPSTCLLWRDIKFRIDSVLVHVKNPKVKVKREISSIYSVLKKKLLSGQGFAGTEKIWGFQRLF